MNFKSFLALIQAQFNEMSKSGQLFISSVSGNELWDIYLNSFKIEDNPVFRDPNSSTHNCNNDKNFIRRYGNIVAIINNKLVSIWDIKLESDNPYYLSCSAMSSKIHNSELKSVFMEEFDFLNKANYERTSTKGSKNKELFQLGVKVSRKQYTEEEAVKFGVVNTKDIYEFNHFNVQLPKKYVNFTGHSVESIVGELNTTCQLFQKGLNIPIETLELVRDLIQQGSLLRGDMYLSKVVEFIKLKKEYDKLDSTSKQLWIWSKFQSVPFARFANELIGTTCIELAEGKDINKVCKDFNYRVDPINYNKAKSPITPQMIALAEKTIMELGYETSFNRRFANIGDIDISEIRHSNINNSMEKPVGLFEQAGVKPTSLNRHKRNQFDKVETVHIDKFMSDILPNAKSVEVFMENRFESNLVSLFTTVDKESKNLFKWNNPFSWTYNGNLSGKSMIKDNVKNAGGKITGVLRCSLQWNDEDTKGCVDYDLHCKTPHTTIYFSNKKCNNTGGQLDVDMIRPSGIGIENITWQNKLQDGEYHFIVDTFCNGNNTGFKIEIEFDGNVYNYHYNQSTAFKSKTEIATITVKNGQMSITHHLPESNSDKTLWNLNTNEFHKVNLICTSPNHWGDNQIGTKEYFFMLQDCKTDTEMRAFHIDQLNSELMSNRKAIDLLGNYKLVSPADKQLSGIGFNCTTRDELIVKVKGTHERTLKLQF